MAKSKIITSLKDLDVLRYLRFIVTESAAATFTEIEIDTQLSIERGVIWLIRSLELDIPVDTMDDPAVDTSEGIAIAVTRSSQSDIISFNDPDLVMQYAIAVNRANTIGTPAGPLWWIRENPSVQKFSIPIVYAGVSIFVGIKSTSAGAKVVSGRIGYSLAKVSDQDFFRVANAILS